MNKAELKKLALLDLKRSGLTEADYKKMGLKLCDQDEAGAVLNSSFATFGYILPYHDPSGKPIDSIRFKFLEELYNKQDKVVKYSQPKGTEPRLYFPRCTKWGPILKDTSKPITFTEGEKKAYKASKEGIPTIGLGGVWSFKCKRLRKDLIDDFNHINLSGRTVYLCFDNDATTNEDVMKALRAFAKELTKKGAHVINKKLPFNPYEKIGLDDFLVANKKSAFEDLEEEEFNEITVVQELNNEVAYIQDVGKFYVMEHSLFVSASGLKNEVFSNRTMPDDNGNQISIANQWLKDPNRRTHTRLTYKPGEPKITVKNEYNLWEGWGCQPEQGSVKPFMHAVDKLFGGNKELVNWFLDWIAYPIQNPGEKMLSGVLLQSVEQGTGKSSIGLSIGAMYGKNFGLIDDAQLHGAFNEWAVSKQFILGDEISGKDKRAESDRIKNLITRPEIIINKKYAPTYAIPDCINYLFTSNHPDALNIEPDDRRFFVHKIEPGNGLTLKQGKALEDFRKGKGKSYLLHYFAYEHKISRGFDSRARPPMTESKADLIDNSLTDIERFLTLVKENPSFYLAIDEVPIDRDLFTVSQVISLFMRHHPRTHVTHTAMGKAINKIFPDSKTHVVATMAGAQRLRPLRNIDKWNSASHKDMQKHYDRSKIALFEARKSKHKAEK